MEDENADEVPVSQDGRARSGKARMDKLTKAERTELGRIGATRRWRDANGNKLPIERTDHTGTLRLGESEIPCAVLADGTRLVSERALVKSFGGKRGGAHWRRMKQPETLGANLPVILSANNLRPFISNELVEALNDRRLYVGPGMRSPAHGVRAQLYPQICEVFLKARDAKALHPKQEAFAVSADILTRGLAAVGIMALVDEATGFQQVRDQHALEEILNQYVGRELAKWAKRFPDEFYEQMFRLQGWHFNPLSSKRPMAMARLTIDLVFDRIGPGLTHELRHRRQEILQTTGKKGKLHQLMTPELGHPSLQHHLSGLIFLAKAYPDDGWTQFYEAVERVAPRYNRTLPLPWGDDASVSSNGPSQPSSR